MDILWWLVEMILFEKDGEWVQIREMNILLNNDEAMSLE